MDRWPFGKNQVVLFQLCGPVTTTELVVSQENYKQNTGQANLGLWTPDLKPHVFASCDSVNWLRSSVDLFGLPAAASASALALPGCLCLMGPGSHVWGFGPHYQFGLSLHVVSHYCLTRVELLYIVATMLH